MIGCNVTVILLSCANAMNDGFAREGDNQLPTMIFIQRTLTLYGIENFLMKFY